MIQIELFCYPYLFNCLQLSVGYASETAIQAQQ